MLPSSGDDWRSVDVPTPHVTAPDDVTTDDAKTDDAKTEPMATTIDIPGITDHGDDHAGGHAVDDDVPELPRPAAGPDAPTPRRRRRRWALLAILVVVVAYGVYAAVRLVDAERSLHAGIAEVDGLRNTLSATDLSDPATVRATAATLRQATADFDGAHAAIDSPLFGPITVVPYVGRQLQSVDALSGTAGTIGGAAAQALDDVDGFLSQSHPSPADRARTAAALATSLGSLASAVDHANLGPSEALLPALANGRNAFARDLARLQPAVDRAQGASAAVATLLNRHQTYLVFAGNNAEMRDGSATELQAGTLSTGGGRLHLGDLNSTQNLASPTPLAPMPGDLAARWGTLHPNEDYRNLGLSPQFALNAPLAAAMWQKQTGQKVDGVLSLDVVALRDLLTATGPVVVDGTTFDATNVEQYLFVTEYVGVTSATANIARRDELGNLADTVVAALQQRSIPPGKLATAVADAAAGRHLLAWSAGPSMEADWQAAGAAGQLGSHDLLLGTINKGVNKLDPYQQIDAQLSTTPAGPDTKVTVTAQITNHTPSGLPSYAAGGNVSDAPVGYYTGALALDLPRYAGDATVSGGTSVAASGADGPSRVLAESIAVPPGGSATVTWTFTVRGHHGTLQIDPSARVPAVQWSTTHATFTDATSHPVRW